MQKGFVIDTNKYSGNFERELCAFITGHTGDCGVGDEERDEYLENHEALAGILQVADEHGCERPCKIYPTAGLWNNGMGGHYEDGQEEEALQAWKIDMIDYNCRNIEMYQSYYATLPHTWTVEKLDKVIAELRAKNEEVLATASVKKYPAYQSVIIYFYNEPSQEVIGFMMQRAHEFANSGRVKGLEILGFSYVEYSPKYKEV